MGSGVGGSVSGVGAGVVGGSVAGGSVGAGSVVGGSVGWEAAVPLKEAEPLETGSGPGALPSVAPLPLAVIAVLPDPVTVKLKD